MKILEQYLKTDLPEIRPGDIVKVHQRIKETVIKGKKREEKERIQVFEGLVIARKHGTGINATITVRKIVDNVGVEKTFPIHTPTVENIEIVSRSKVRRAKLYFLRDRVGKKARLKRQDYVPEVKSEPKEEESVSEEPKKQESQEKPETKEQDSKK